MKIVDDFLPKELFDKIQTFFMGGEIDWHFNPFIVYPDGRETGENKFQFEHIFYKNNAPCSMQYSIIFPLLNKIKPVSMWRIKANLLTITPNNIQNDFHIDIGGLPDEKLNILTTAIFYINTNNGCTVFEDDTKVESVANRLVTFPSNLMHCGTSCTDKKTRIVINFNYFK
jgi:hypothetical protein